MPTIDYEAEYDNRSRVPESADIMRRWTEMSEAYRTSATSTLDVPYGASAKQAFDIFHARADKSEVGPLVVYIHGGYWQRGDRKDYSFVARGLNERGIDVAVPSYVLCPTLPVSGIVAELKTFLGVLSRRSERRAVIVGHSAGGHLGAALLSGHGHVGNGVPANFVASVYGLSGVYDLVPLVETSLNGALRLDAVTARAQSPLFWKPPHGARFVAAVGGLESTEFLRQSLDLADMWSRAGAKAECVVVPNTNHFTIVEELLRVEGAMVQRIAELAAQSLR
jgi:arylformamidase